MIWTLAMVQGVERLGMSLALDHGWLYSYPAGKAKAQEDLARKLVKFAHPLGVEINPEDVAFREFDDDFCLKITARWSPSTTLVEFRGGYVDGQRTTVAPDLIRQPIKIPQLVSNLARVAPDETTPLLSESLQYELAGWHEQERHWIYDATPTR